MDYRGRKSQRIKGYSYSRPGVYFITIRVISSSKFLSQIDNGIVTLSELGEIIRKSWEEIPQHYKGASLDEYIIMPDHIHGIIFLTDTLPQTFTLSSIINAFKSICTRRIKLINTGRIFQWQRSFYDHIIRSNTELIIKRNYIKANPLRWSQQNK